MEFLWAMVACIGVLFFGTLKGIVVAIIVSLIGLSSQTANPPVYVIGRKRGADVLRPLSPTHPDDELLEGLLILRPEGRIYFINAQNIADKMSAMVEQYRPRVVVLDMSRVRRRTALGQARRDPFADFTMILSQGKISGNFAGKEGQ